MVERRQKARQAAETSIEDTSGASTVARNVSRTKGGSSSNSNPSSSSSSISRTKEEGHASSSWSVYHALVHLPAQIMWTILDMMGLSVFSSQIVRVYPKSPAKLTLPAKPANRGETGAISEDEGGGKDKRDISFSEWIDENVPSIHGTFTPTWWLANGHFQTGYSVVGDFTKIDNVEYDRTYLGVPDGGTLGLDFTPLNHASLPDDTPTLVVCHGLTGGSHESYVRNVVAKVILPVEQGGLGVRAVVINFRGCAGVPLTSDQMYSAGTTIDLATSLHYLRSIFPSSPLHGIGFSLGASVLSRYLGESSSLSLLSSGLVLGTPWDLPSMTIRLEHNWFYSRVYSRAMAKNLINLFFRHYDQSPKIWDESERMGKGLQAMKDMRTKGVTLKTVDGVLTSKMGGPENIGLWPFAGADEYYAWASPKKVIGGVRRPLLAINAFDDPIIDAGALPIDEVASSSYACMAITGGGGHLGWFTGPGARERWIAKPALEYLRSAMRDFGLAGPAITVRRTPSPSPPRSEGSSGDEGENWEKVKRPGEEAVHGRLGREVEKGEGSSSSGGSAWEWVDEPAHEISGVGGAGKVGWRVLEKHEVIEGAEGSGTLQGL